MYRYGLYLVHNVTLQKTHSWLDVGWKSSEYFLQIQHISMMTCPTNYIKLLCYIMLCWNARWHAIGPFGDRSLHPVTTNRPFWGSLVFVCGRRVPWCCLVACVDGVFNDFKGDGTWNLEKIGLCGVEECRDFVIILSWGWTPTTLVQTGVIQMVPLLCAHRVHDCLCISCPALPTG